MKIIFLNTWNGKIKDSIIEFIQEQSKDTDVFCFQEVYPEMRQLCREVLPDYEEFYAYKIVAKDDDFPQATFVRKNIGTLSFELVLNDQTNCGLGINVLIKQGDTLINICNFHGIAFPGDKLDNPSRLEQSKELINFLKNKKGLKIIGGDFNMLPETASMRMFEKKGYRDLIKEFKIKATRNRLAWEMYPDNPQYYSDYVFLSQGVKIEKFAVLNNEISDHLPLILEIED